MATQAQSKQQSSSSFLLFRFLFSKEFGLIALLSAVVIFFYIQEDSARQTRVYFDMLREVSPNIIAMIGIATLMIAGEFDLSIGSMLAVSGVTTIVMFNVTDNMYAGIAAGISTGIIVGIIHGYLITVLDMDSLVTTLGTMFALRGIVFVYTNQTATIDENGFRSFQNLYHDEIHTVFCRLGVFSSESSLCEVARGAAARDLPWYKLIPLPVVIALFLVLLFIFVMSQTEFGRKIYAIGSNPVAATVSGIKVKRIKFSLFVLTSTLAAFSGVLLAAQTGSGYFNAGSTGFELNVIAATVLGGVSLAGGSGGLVGAFLGVIILGMTSKGMRLMQIDIKAQLLVTGAIMLAAVYLHDLRKRLLNLRKN